MTLAHLPRDIAGGAKVFGKDNVVGAQFRFKPRGSALAVALNIAVASGEIGSPRRRAQGNRAERIREEGAVLHEGADRGQLHMARKRTAGMVETRTGHVSADQQDVRARASGFLLKWSCSGSRLREAEARSGLLSGRVLLAERCSEERTGG